MAACDFPYHRYCFLSKKKLLPLFILCLSWLSSGVLGYNGAKMGVVTACDDAKTRLEVDWPKKHFRQFTCSGATYAVDPSIPPEYYSMPPPFNAKTDGMNVYHHCMNETISYPQSPPLRGDHRPNWAVFGEYLYLPPQRWLHNLEHGAIVMLYDPCANETEIAKLRTIVTGCLYRHVITPYKTFTRDLDSHHLYLLAWGASLRMNAVHTETAIAFIRKHAKVAPENLWKQGKFNDFLLKAAKPVPGSDIKDSRLCPNDK